MSKKENKKFLEKVALPLVGVALCVIVLAFGADAAITIHESLGPWAGFDPELLHVALD
jgi:hypothetical protein